MSQYPTALRGRQGIDINLVCRKLQMKKAWPIFFPRWMSVIRTKYLYHHISASSQLYYLQVLRGTTFWQHCSLSLQSDPEKFLRTYCGQPTNYPRGSGSTGDKCTVSYLYDFSRRSRSHLLMILHNVQMWTEVVLLL